MPICTHLSIHIVPSQFFLGKEEPGIVKRTVEIISQQMAGMKEGFIFFKQD